MAGEIQGSFQSLPWPVQRMMMQRMAEQNQARKAAGPALYGMFPEGGQQQPPALPAPPPGAMSPGGGNPAVQPQPQPQAQPGPAMQRPPMHAQPPSAAPQAAAAPTQRPAMPQIAPFRALPTPPQGAPQGGDPSIAPPPAADGAPGARPFDIKALVTGLRKQGIPGEKVMDMLDELAPVMNAQNRQELDALKVHNNALREANAAYARVIQAEASRTRAETGVTAEQRRREQGDERNKIAREKLSKQVGGEDKIVRWETDDNGNIVGGRTRTGKHIVLDKTEAPKTGDGKGGKAAAVRQGIVKAGVVNSLARLEEIEKKHPQGTTSIFFGTHGDNPATRGVYGAGQAMQSGTQQDIDAKWASFIDEAIPVFTGGLRGSDAFRRFLIEQAPGPGAKPATVKEKMRLFRENIEGTNRAFFDKFTADPKMWAPGTKPEDVEAAKGGGAAKPDALPKGVPAGSKVIGKTPAGKDVYQAPDGKNYTAD